MPSSGGHREEDPPRPAEIALSERLRGLEHQLCSSSATSMAASVRFAASQPQSLISLHNIARSKSGSCLWYFAADQAGTYDIRCGHEAHAKAGMVGKIIVG